MSSIQAIIPRPKCKKTGAGKSTPCRDMISHAGVLSGHFPFKFEQDRPGSEVVSAVYLPGRQAPNLETLA